MEEKEKQQEKGEALDITLEEILREFGSFGEEEQEVLPAQPGESGVSSDTVRLDEITRALRKTEPEVAQTQRFAPVEDDSLEKTASFSPVQEGDLEQTLRFKPVADAELEQTLVDLEQTLRFVPLEEDPELAQTLRFGPVEAEQEPPVIRTPEVPRKPKAEPYAEGWEPEYEMPMGEYIPPEPIVFRPKSRLGELKRKLVEGPERRYYELSERGVGKLQLAMFLQLLVVALAAATTVLYALGVIGPERVKLVIFCQFLSLLLSALFGSYQLMEGIADLFKGHFSLNTLLIFSLLACLADGVLGFRQLRIPSCAAFSLNMLTCLWSAYHKRTTEQGQMDTLRKATRLDSLVSDPDYYEGRQGFLRGQGQVEDFMDRYQAPSGFDKTVSVYALVALGMSIAIGVTAGVLHSMTLGVQAAAATLLTGVPATLFITTSRPMAILERRLHQLGTVICGPKAVKQLSRPGSFPLEETDLFPGGAVKLNGVKFYGSREPDLVIAYAAALMNACGGTMAPLMSQLLESRSGYHYDAEGLRHYPGGIGAEVDGEAVLAGSMAFLRSMGVEIPDGTRVNQAVYVAIDGEFSGVFAVTYQKLRSAATGLHTLCAYRRLMPVMVTRDFMLSESFVRSRFGCNTRRMAFPEPEIRQALAEKRAPEDAQTLAVTTKDGLASMAYAVTGARALQGACKAGMVVQLLGGILGIAMMLVLAVLGAAELLTPVNVLLYQLLWTVPGLLITEWTRSV